MSMSPKPMLIAGPCMLEGPEVVTRVAETVKEIAGALPADTRVFFKGSFDKANRSSGDTVRGPGLAIGLELLQIARIEFGLQLCTDIHETAQIDAVASVADMIQIPAFLSRQTDLIEAAAKTGKTLLIKKGQFLSPEQALQAYEKAHKYNKDVYIGERGTSFGYGDLVVDLRASIFLQSKGVPVVYDATHSVQQPGGLGDSSGGKREYTRPLAMAARAVGVQSLFAELHPDPARALSDAAVQLNLTDGKELIKAFFSFPGTRTGTYT